MSYFLGERVSFIYTHQPNDVLQKIALECVRRDVCNNNFISGPARMLTTPPLVKLYQVTEIFFLPSSMFPSVQLIPCSAYTKHSKICFCGENLTEKAMHLSDLKVNILLTYYKFFRLKKASSRVACFL